ncbi:DEKNAAC105487 [Brettanomyces naardenensis]|uniref:DEKNAAC105487 n=1 Tax=Brettanomyces naardenensis TaxID=13370 RepID=A0A448YTY8_BRENA|nr:DEKNAAC105487 [Brettanomyces naardenensis]
MNTKRAWLFLCSPFLNLTPRARMLQIGRLGTSLLIVTLIFVLYYAPMINTHFYLARLDCSHVDVSNGIFSALESSMNGPQSYNGSSNFLTTSEIHILADYVREQVSTAAQFIHSDLMGWCYGTYSSVEAYNSETSTFILLSKGDSSMHCSGTSVNYVFDYRQQLNEAGLNIILSYAYPQTQQNAPGTSDPQYTKSLIQRREKNASVIYTMAVAAALHATMLIAGIMYYGQRGFHKDDRSMPPLPKHIFGVTAILAFALLFVAVMINISLIQEIRREVGSELGSFGLLVHIGGAWLAVFWVAVGLSFTCIFLWGGPTWCAPPQTSLDTEEMLLLTENENTREASHEGSQEGSSREDTLGGAFETDTVTDPVIDYNSRKGALEHVERTITVDSTSSGDSSTRRVLCGKPTLDEPLLHGRRFRRPPPLKGIQLHTSEMDK